MGFVQTPQFYKNHTSSYVAAGAWEQQELFFGAICKGKNRLNSTFMCGTNMVLRRDALKQVGGMCEENIAEDFLTSLFLHERGWHSMYVPEVLAEGLAPEDFLSYYKQQFRWARGSLEVLFRHNPLLNSTLSWAQKFQYLASASFYVSGAIVVLNALLPLAYFFTGKVPFTSSTMLLASVFLPYIFLTMYVLQRCSGYTLTFRAVAFSIASFPIHLSALWSVLLKRNNGFSVTSKQKVAGNFLPLVIPHIAYFVVGTLGLGIALAREGASASLITNASWMGFNMVMFLPFILAAAPTPKPAASSHTSRQIAPAA
jgi:cellulose synthase (UDP-forming)